MVAIETDNLILKPMQIEFATENYCAWLNDKDVNQYLEIYEEQTLEKLTHYVENAVKNKIYFWAICLKSNDKHIGNIKIVPINFYHQYGEYGILMGDKTEWGKGYAKEASIAVIDFCFSKLELRKVYLGVVSNNKPAYELYKKLGFDEEGLYLNHGKYNNDYCNVARMAIYKIK